MFHGQQIIYTKKARQLCLSLHDIHEDTEVHRVYSRAPDRVVHVIRFESNTQTCPHIFNNVIWIYFFLQDLQEIRRNKTIEASESDTNEQWSHGG